MIDRNKAVATILGVAIGDALGAPTEFAHESSIKARFGPDGIEHINQTSGNFTDDTQMTEALGLGVLDAFESADQETCGVVASEGRSDPDYIMPFIARRFVEWSRSPENNRSPGGSCMHGCRQLGRGTHWKKSGATNSKGCGSAMRASPVGIVYEDADVIRNLSKAQSICTHGHPAAGEAAEVAALAVSLLLRTDTDPFDVFHACRGRITDPTFAALMDQVLPLVEETLAGRMTPWKAQRHGYLGESWVGDEAVASAFYCFLLAHSENSGYVGTVRHGANTDGDSDSIAAIGGSFAGAHWGLGGEHGIPQEWIAKVERGAELTVFAERLFGIAQKK